MPFFEPGVSQQRGSTLSRLRRKRQEDYQARWGVQSAGFGAFNYNLQRTSQLRLLFKPWQTWEEVFPGRNVCPLCGTKMTGPINPNVPRPPGV